MTKCDHCYKSTGATGTIPAWPTTITSGRSCYAGCAGLTDVSLNGTAITELDLNAASWLTSLSLAECPALWELTLPSGAKFDNFTLCYTPYGVNSNIFTEKIKETRIKQPSATIMMTESVRSDQEDQRGGYKVCPTKQTDYNPFSRHGNSIVTSWIDGHATTENVPMLTLDAIYNTPVFANGATEGDPGNHWDIY